MRRHVRQGQRRHLPLLACSGRQKLGRRGCDRRRINRDKLEAAVLAQLTGIYSDGTLIRQGIEHATAQRDQNRAASAERRAALAKEIAQAERALDRYQQAFETGRLGAERFAERVSALDSRLEALREQDHGLAQDIATHAPTSPDTEELGAVAFYCVVDALPEQCLRRRLGVSPLVVAVFRTKRLLR